MQTTNLVKSQNYLRILYAESGVERWYSANVATAIIRQLRQAQAKGQTTIRIREEDTGHMIQMMVVLHLGNGVPNFGLGGGWSVPAGVDVDINKVLAPFAQVSTKRWRFGQ